LPVVIRLRKLLLTKKPMHRNTPRSIHSPNQADVSEAELGLVTLLDDFKSNLRALPFARIGSKCEVGIENVPNDLGARNEFSDLLFGIMDALVAIRELVAQAFGATFNVP